MAGKGLGSGLGALFGDDAFIEKSSLETLPISKIEPKQDQPRSTFDEEALSELSSSIAEHGVIQPLTVRRLDGGYYQIVAGERRWRAARMAGLKEVPVRVIEADDRKTMELSLVENLQREDLNPVEEARGYQKLLEEYSLTQEKIAAAVGKSRPAVANALRLLGLPASVLELMEKGKLSLSHARIVLEAEGQAVREKIAQEIVEKGLTVRQTEALVKRLRTGGKKKPAKNDAVDYVAEVEKEMQKALGRGIRVIAGRKKGKIEIDYYDPDDFETLREALISLKGKLGGKKS